MSITYTRARDGRPATEAEALDASGAVRDGYALRKRAHLQPGEHIAFDLAFFDAITKTHDVAAARSFFTDAAGKPISFVDTLTGAPVRIDAALITAMTSEAARVGVPMDRYVADHLRYSTGA